MIKVKQKGNAFERLIANEFKKIFPKARRHLENQIEEAAHGVDLINVGRYLVQCKHYANYAPLNKIEEVKVDPLLGGCPILVTRGNGKPILAALPLHELLDLIRIKEKYDKQRRESRI